jgi:formate hydrogenlyase subunit 3/multisubunit Na+/H+ antiporter MnhD subunit
MKKGLSRIVVGILCIVIAGYLIFSTNEEIEMWQIVVGAYGLFSLGIGIYFYQKERNVKP